MSSKYIQVKTYILRTKMSAHSFLTRKENQRYEENRFNIKKLNENITFKEDKVYMHS